MIITPDEKTHKQVNSAKEAQRFDPQMYRAALAYYGLPADYAYTFKQKVLTKDGKERSTLVSCNAPAESARGCSIWVQINRVRPDTPLKKAKIEDIEQISNITFDFEYPTDPEWSHIIASQFLEWLIKQGLALPETAIENSGAGDHIVIPIPTIQTASPDDAKLWNRAVTTVVKTRIQPEFDRLVKEYGIEVNLGGFNIDRVLSVPGTWRSYRPDKHDCDALKAGVLRRWLDPYTDGNYPERRECAKLADLIREAYAQLKQEQETPKEKKSAPTSDNQQRPSKTTSTAWGLKALEIECEYVRTARNGTRNNQLFKSAAALGEIVAGGNLDQWEVERELTAAAAHVGLTGDEIEKTLKSGIETGLAHPRRPEVSNEQLCKYDPDDAGNADAMYALFGRDILWCHARGWFLYNGRYWKLDADGSEIKKHAITTLRKRRHAAVDLEKEAIIKVTKANDKQVNGCISLFKTLVSVDIEEFDSNPDVINCKNGVVDLRTGEITPHSSSQRFTYCVPVPYEKSDSLVWINYLEGVVGGGQEVIDYLQMALGYTFTGHTREEILFYLYGLTRSGKGTIAETIMALLPTPIATMVDFNSFTAKREGDVSNFDLAPLKPSRIIFASESNRSQSLNPAKIKQLTGGDRVRACFKHKDFFEYRPQFKVWMLSNWPVNGDPEDDALWGRVRVIEFPNSYLGREDKTKKAELKKPENLKGILYWIVQGAIKWYALGSKGLETPEAVEIITQKQRDELDYVQQWLDDCGEQGEGEWTSNEVVAASYANWCKDNNVQYPKGPKALAQSLKTKGFTPSEARYVQEFGKMKRGVGGLKIVAS